MRLSTYVTDSAYRISPVCKILQRLRLLLAIPQDSRSLQQRLSADTGGSGACVLVCVWKRSKQLKRHARCNKKFTETKFLRKNRLCTFLPFGHPWYIIPSWVDASLANWKNTRECCRCWNCWKSVCTDYCPFRRTRWIRIWANISPSRSGTTKAILQKVVTWAFEVLVIYLKYLACAFVLTLVTYLYIIFFEKSTDSASNSSIFKWNAWLLLFEHKGDYNKKVRIKSFDLLLASFVSRSLSYLGRSCFAKML